MVTSNSGTKWSLKRIVHLERESVSACLASLNLSRQKLSNLWYFCTHTHTHRGKDASYIFSTWRPSKTSWNNSSASDGLWHYFLFQLAGVGVRLLHKGWPVPDCCLPTGSPEEPGRANAATPGDASRCWSTWTAASNCKCTGLQAIKTKSCQAATKQECSRNG